MEAAIQGHKCENTVKRISSVPGFMNNLIILSQVRKNAFKICIDTYSSLRNKGIMNYFLKVMGENRMAVVKILRELFETVRRASFEKITIAAEKITLTCEGILAIVVQRFEGYSFTMIWA